MKDDDKRFSDFQRNICSKLLIVGNVCESILLKPFVNKMRIDLVYTFIIQVSVKIVLGECFSGVIKHYYR